MRISDWSSDVCSSDLARNGPRIKSGVTREEGRTEECYSTSQEKSRWSPAPIRALGRGSRSRSPKPEPISPPRVARLRPRRSRRHARSEEHPSELQSLMRISYAVFRLKQKNTNTNPIQPL